MKNPWLGLSSYSEESLKEYGFHGRSQAITMLSGMIRRNLFVTLYGRSGIGKTSLLQAGVFPLLRKEDFLPVTVRFVDLGNDISAAEIIWKTLLEKLKEEGMRFEPCDRKDRYEPDFNDDMVLRNLFSSGRFIGPGGKEILPVLVLDQFEEILYKAPLAAKKLITQLYALIDDCYDLSMSHPGWHDDTNFRIVVSIREDDLFMFEDVIDKLGYADLKSNRYRLLPLSEEEAREVILEPGKGLFPKDKKNEVADAIIRLVSGDKGGGVNTLMLSLMCYVLYNDVYLRKGVITEEDLSRHNDIIEAYYLETVKGLPSRQRYYLEDKLIDSQGRRQSAYLADVEKNAPMALPLAEATNRRILNISQGRVEFIHDQLAASVSKIRESRKSSRLRVLGISFMLLSLLIIFFVSFSRVPEINKETDVHSVDLSGLANNDKVVEYTIDSADNYPFKYIIDDCPRLKRIRIERKDCNLEVYRCPSLVEIETPLDFLGDIKVFDCDNLMPHSQVLKLTEESFGDSIKVLMDVYSSEHIPGRDKDVLIPVPYVDYKPDTNVLEFRETPNARPFLKTHRAGSIAGIYRAEMSYKTYLPDSLKRLTDCYVPFGTKDKFLSLKAFQPFRSINEMPVYMNWVRNIRHLFLYMYENRASALLSLLGLLAVQCFFWFTAFQDYRRKYKSLVKVLLFSFCSGLGMSFVALLAFMAFYWALFMQWPELQGLAISVGLLACVAALSLCYKGAFYAVWLYFKRHGLTGAIEDSGRWLAKLWNRYFDFVSRRPLACVLCCLIIAILFFGYKEYKSGKEQRQRYLVELSRLANNGQYGKVRYISEALLEKYSSPVYGFFTDGIRNIQQRMEREYLVANVDLNYVRQLAADNDISMDIRDLYFGSEVSPDGRFYYIRAYNKSTDSYKKLCINLFENRLDTIYSGISDIGSRQSFSPSSKFMVIAGDDNVCSLYNTETGATTKFDLKKDVSIIDIIMTDDSTVYYSTDKRDVYYQKLGNSSAPELIFSSGKWLTADSETKHPIVVGVFSWGADLKIRHGATSPAVLTGIGDLYSVRYANQDYAVTTKGLYDFSVDSLTVRDPNLYSLLDNVVKIEADYNNIDLLTLEGDTLASINALGSTLNFDISDDGRFWLIKGDNTLVLSLEPDAKFSWKLTRRERELFGL